MKQLNLWPCAFLIALLLFGVPVTAQQKLNSSQTNRVERNAKTTISTEEETLKTTDISPLEAFKSKKEVVSKRDAYSKHYQNEDGSYTALIGAGPIHYEKNGQLEDIDHSITRSGNATFPYANTTNLFESYFGETSHTGVKNKTAEGEIIEFLNTKMYWEVNGRPVNERASANVSVTIDGDKAYYNNLYGNIAAEFITLTGKRKLNYIIPTRQEISNAPQNADYLVFTEDVVLPEGWTSKGTEHGILITNPAGKEIYLYENPVSTDAANALDREVNTVFETELNGNILTVMTKVKTEWLLSNDRQFPVMVDPIVSVYPNNTSNWVRSFASDGYEYTSLLYFGREPSTTGNFIRMFMKFNTSSIPTNVIVNSATGYINLTAGRGTSPATRQWQFTNSADPTTTSGTTLYNSVNTGYSNITDVTGTGWRNSAFYNPAGNVYIQNQLVNGSVFYGINPTGSYNYDTYMTVAGATSSLPPYLTINYTEPITDRTLTVSGAHIGASPVNGSHTYANNTPVTASSGTREGYLVTGWTGTGSVPATGNTDSATFTITENSSITWQWQQTGTPKDVVFHNYGGAEQLAFNNSRIATNTPVFRMSHSAYDANAYQVEINMLPNFTGTAVTQEFTAANAVNNEMNFTFNNSFTPTDGTTYYVRARVKGEAEIWSSYTTDTYSFTYSSSQTTPEWFQTTQAQFLTDQLSGTQANASGDVVTGAGGNRVVNGDFNSAPTTGWTVTGTSGTARVVNLESNPNNWGGGNWLRMGSPNFSGGASGTTPIVVSQSIDLTNVSQITFNAGYYYSVGSPFVDNPNTKIEFKIGGSLTDISGSAVYTNQPNYSGQGYSYYNFGTQTVDVSSYSGVQIIKFVMTYNVSWHGNGTVYYLFDNVIANAPPSGTITSTPIHLASALGAEGYEGITWNQTLNGGELALTVQGSTDGVSFTDIPEYTNMSEAGDGTKNIDLSGMTEVPAHVRLVGTLDGAGVKLHDWSVQFAGLPDPTYDFTYINDTDLWTPNYPGDPSNPSAAEHSIGILEGTATFNTNIIAGTLTVNADANLDVEKILKLHGDIINNGLITFKSSSIQNTAQFDEFEGEITGIGHFTTERYIPARRSYRFLSPSVTTAENIYKNWQEDGNNIQGLGTHITGANPVENGFDPTGTNNPSMFLLDVGAQSWASVANTNVEKLTAGHPYLIMIRGDRNTDLTSNNATPSPTVLRATGDLATGDITFTGPMLTVDQEIFIGNPYQASVSIEQLLLNATNIKLNHYHLYNPQIGGANGMGAYVAVDLDFGWESTPESEANGYLQPGQAILVKANGNGIPTVIFKESFKSVDEPLTETFRGTISRLALHLYNADDYNIGQTPVDGISIKFSENGNNGIDDYDVPKMGNFDENLGIFNDGGIYSIESRAYPENEEVIQLSTRDYKQTQYVFEGKFNIPVEQTTVYLYDSYTDVYTEISDEEAVSYSFEVDPAIDASYSNDRFDIRFVARTMGVDDLNSSTVAVYPNPFDGQGFQIAAPGMEGKALGVHVTNMLGQRVYSSTVTVQNGKAAITLAETISSGIYNVNIVSEDGQSINKKLIRK